MGQVFAGVTTGNLVLLGAADVLWVPESVTSYGDRLGLPALVAVAMGVRGRVRVTPTDYFTGTLTSLAGRVALRELRGGDGWVLGRLTAVAAAAPADRWWSPGAALGAVVTAAGAPTLGRSRAGAAGSGRTRGSPGRIGGIQPGRLECGREGRSPLGGQLHGALAVRSSPCAAGEARGHCPSHTHV